MTTESRRRPLLLHERLAITLVSLTAVTALVQGLGYWAAERWVENRGITNLQREELDRRTAMPIDVLGDDGGGLLYFRAAEGRAPPPAIARLAPGLHPHVVLAGTPYQVLVRELAPGDRAIVLYDISSLEAREGVLIALVEVGVVLTALVAWRASRQLTRRALAPLDALVAQIRSLNPERRGARLTGETSGDLAVIVQAINAYMAQLDALVERERAFAAAASHELRTPLAVIGGAAEILAGSAAPAGPVQRIERAVAQARQDLEALLALSRGEAEASTPLALERLLPQWAETQFAASPESAPRIDWQLQPHSVCAPAGSLHTVFTNLLRNAARAAGTGGRIGVELHDGVLAVVDSGPGIPPDELPHVFEPRFRGRDGGTGIGLYVAQALAQRQGWSLRLRNRPEGGARAELAFA